MYYFKIPSELLHYMYFIPLQSGQEQKEVINSDSKVNFKPGVLIPVDASILLWNEKLYWTSFPGSFLSREKDAGWVWSRATQILGGIK